MLQKILDYLPGDFPWRDTVHWYPVIESTNTEAKHLAAAGAPGGTVLIADCQTGGRGRLGRSFQSPAGMGIYLSVLLRFPCQADRLMHLTCAAAEACCRGVENGAGFYPSIKWTNDLVYKKRKIAGILTELVSLPGETCAVIGIGINCNQEPEDFPSEIQAMAGSVRMVTGKAPDRAKLAAELIVSLKHMQDTLFTEKAVIMDAYRTHCVTLGQEISILNADSVMHGNASDLDENGGLIVTFPDGCTRTIACGEVSIRGMYGYL